MSDLHVLSHPHPTTDAAQPPSVLEHGLRLIRERWQLTLAVWAVVMAASVATLWYMPRQYRSEATFLVKNTRQELLIGPNDQASAVYRDDVPEEIMHTEMELLRSRGILEKVVAELDLHDGYLSEGLPPGEAMERAIRDLGAGLTTETPRNTNLIRISFMSQEPSQAARVLQHVADAYLASHLAVHSSQGTYELFRQQAEQAGKDLAEAEVELAALGRSMNLILPDEQKRELLQAIRDAETEYTAVTANIREMAARVKEAEHRLASVPRHIRAQVRNLPNQYSIERLNTLIVELRNKRTALLTKFNPDDRLVQEVDQQIEDTTRALEAAQELHGEEETMSVNPAWSELESESLKAQLALAGYAQRATELKQQLEEYRRQSLALTEASPAYHALERRVMEARAKWELYTKKQEEARIAETLDQQRISNVVLAQPPFVPHVPSAPDVRIGLVAGFATATTLAVTAALFAEHISAAFALSRRRRQSHVDEEEEPAAATVLS